MSKRIHEAGTISLDPTTQKYRVLLINEGKGSSAYYPREFFTEENAAALAGSLSFPGHPRDLQRPEQRDPLTAIGSIGDTVTIEENSGLMGFWGEYRPAKSRPEVGIYLAEFADKLGLSVYADSEGRTDSSTGQYIAESIDGSDPYRSVDLVVGAGRGGKFDRIAEGLRRITEASATAGEKEVSQMEIKELSDDFTKKFEGLTKIVEGLVSTLDGTAKAKLQVEADTSAVDKIVESRLADYDKAVGLISDAKLTESQSASLRARALKGEDVAPYIEEAKTILAEARAVAAPEEDGTGGRIAENHLGGGDNKGNAWTASVAGFGKVS